MSRNGATPQRSPAPSPGRDVAWALALKALALVVLYVAFFGPAHRIAVTPDRVAAALIDAAPGEAR